MDGVAFSLHASSPEGTTHTEYRVLDWTRLIRRTWYQPLVPLLVSVGHTCMRYWRCRFLTRVRREAPLTSWAFAYTLTYVVVAVLIALAVPVCAVAAAAATASGEPGAGVVAAVAAIFTAGLAIMLWRWERQLGVRWLLRIATFCARCARNGGREERQLRRYARAICHDLRRAATTEAYDEILLVGHSVGTLVAVAVRAEWARTMTRPLPLLTLGQCIPLSGFLPSARHLRADLRTAVAHDAPWLDITAPPDGACFALHDFTTCAGPLAPRPGTPVIRNARFHRAFSPERYRRLKRAKFDLHFLYLYAVERESAYDFLRITAGPEPLQAAIDRMTVGSS